MSQKHENGESELQPSPVPEDIACESELSPEADNEQRQGDDRGDTPGSQSVRTRPLRLRKVLRWGGVVHASASCQALSPWREGVSSHRE